MLLIRLDGLVEFITCESILQLVLGLKLLNGEIAKLGKIYPYVISIGKRLNCVNKDNSYWVSSNWFNRQLIHFIQIERLCLSISTEIDRVKINIFHSQCSKDVEEVRETRPTVKSFCLNKFSIIRLTRWFTCSVWEVHRECILPEVCICIWPIE